MRIYENLFIVKPDATEEEIDSLIEQMSKNITTTGGTVDKVEKWGKRRLAYRVEKQREGYYVLLTFTADSQAVREFERRMLQTQSRSARLSLVIWLNVLQFLADGPVSRLGNHCNRGQADAAAN